jgi:hypothetical protein
MNHKMKLPLQPFSEEEKSKKYVFTSFKETGKPFGFLRDANAKKQNSGNKYLFGCISKEGDYFWFFNKEVICNDRIKALEIYTALLAHCVEENIGRPFAYKI